MSDERPRVDHDKPPFSRVFVVCSRSHSEEELRSSFEEYGEVRQETIYIHINIYHTVVLLKQRFSTDDCNCSESRFKCRSRQYII